MGLERAKLLLPVALDLLHPAGEGAEGLGAQAEEAHPGVLGGALAGDEAALEQQAQVPTDRRGRGVQGVGQLAREQEPPRSKATCPPPGPPAAARARLGFRVVRSPALLLCLLLPACGHPEAWRGSSDPRWPRHDPLRGVETSIGRQVLADPAYGDLDTLTVLGIEFVEDYGLHPFYLEGGLHYGYDRARRRLPTGERVTSELSRFEFTAGLRLEPYFGRLSLSPYAGLGAALVLVKADLDTEADPQGDDSDSTVGAYWKLGLALPLNYGSHIALELRGVQGGLISTEAFDADIDATMLALVFGFRR